MTSERVFRTAIAAIEKELVQLKQAAKGHRDFGMPVPENLDRRINNLKGQATALRKLRDGENR